MTRTLVLQDERRYNGVPFLIKVYNTKVLVNVKTGQTKRIKPRSSVKPSRKWLKCRAKVAEVRPKYGSFSYNGEYRIEWGKLHTRIVELSQVPKRKIVRYKKEGRNINKSNEEIAREAFQRSKKSFDEQESRVKTSID